MESQAQLFNTATSLPDAKPSKLQHSQAAWCLCTSLRVYRTATTEEAQVAEGLPEENNGIGNSRQKRQRQNHAHPWLLFTRAQFPGGRFPAKFGGQPIKLELYTLAHTYPANYVRVHFRDLGVYKGSRAATKPFRG